MRILDMFPLDLHEFYRAVGVAETTLDMVKECYVRQEAVDAYVHKKLLDVFYLYLIVGWMPEAVQMYLDTNDINQVTQVHEKIVRLYKQDLSGL